VRVATLDVGTNSILLLVLEAGPGGERVLADRCRIERLGQGVDRTGALDPAAIARALDALGDYAGVIREHGVDRVAAVGTQALREARNGADFLGPAARLLGVEVEVIGGLREAELAFAAVRAAFPEHRRGEVVVCDVGGGSTELIVARDGAIASLVSVPIGSVRMAERHLHADPPTAAEAAAMRADVLRALAGQALPRGAPVVGLAGTVTTLAAVALGLAVYDPDRVQGMRLPRAEVERQLALYLSLPLSARREIVGMEAKRADVIAGGAAVVAAVLERVGAQEVQVSDRGIRWGLAAELVVAPSP
jgi:exopolyphosphatase/guanosine-5'-triphosphate,3'-diphosphate pyrophosphatase